MLTVLLLAATLLPGAAQLLPAAEAPATPPGSAEAYSAEKEIDKFIGQLASQGGPRTKALYGLAIHLHSNPQRTVPRLNDALVNPAHFYHPAGPSAPEEKAAQLALIRAGIAEAYGGAAFSEAVPALLARWPQEPDPGVRIKIVEALVTLNSQSPEVLDALVRAVPTENEKVLEQIAVALGRMTGTDAASKKAAEGKSLQALLALTAAKNGTYVRINAVASLGKRKSADAVPRLESILGEIDTTPLQFCVLRALGDIGSPEAFDALFGAFERPRPQISESAAEVLGRMGALSHGPLVKALGDRTTSAAIRAGAALALGIGGRPEAAAALTRAALTDPEEWVRKRAAEALGKINERLKEKSKSPPDMTPINTVTSTDRAW